MPYDDRGQSGTGSAPRNAKVLLIRDRYAKVNAVYAIEKIGNHGAAILQARGNSISDAVSVANIVTRRMLKGNSKVERVTIDSIELPDTGQLISTIEIVLTKL